MYSQQNGFKRKLGKLWFIKAQIWKKQEMWEMIDLNKSIAKNWVLQNLISDLENRW